MTQTALAADLDLTKVAIGGLIERMEAAGLVERRADHSDARIRRVHLTPAGNRLIGQIRRQVERFEQEALGPNTSEELATTTATLRRMKETLVRMIGDEGLPSGRSDEAA
jgi:DNA-binding MarR family transcriptional regulator